MPVQNYRNVNNAIITRSRSATGRLDKPGRIAGVHVIHGRHGGAAVRHGQDAFRARERLRRRVTCRCCRHHRPRLRQAAAPNRYDDVIRGMRNISSVFDGSYQ